MTEHIMPDHLTSEKVAAESASARKGPKVGTKELRKDLKGILITNPEFKTVSGG
jgi:hypothetical protein